MPDIRDALSLDAYEQRLLDDVMALKILDILFEKGDIDLWISAGDKDCSVVERLPPPVAAILVRSDILSADGHVNPLFSELIKHRGDFFKAKLKYFLMALQDFLESADDMLWKPEQFMMTSRIFSGFDYSKGFEVGEDARNITKAWSDYVSALSKYESCVIVERLVGVFETETPVHVLELGGNMGVFGQEFENYFSPQSYVIVDIPQVCDLGEEYIRARVPASRIKFVRGDMFETDWTIEANARPDTIIFKSVLHDWPQYRAMQLVDKACRHLAQGGRLIIVERCEFLARNIFEKKLCDAANIVFAPFYRNPEHYLSMIEAVPMHCFSTDIHFVDIDMKWFCLVARKI